MPRREEDPFKEKFRPSADTQLDREVDDALSGLSEDVLYGFDKARQPPSPPDGPRRGRITSIEAKTDSVFVDFGGKSQGVAARSQFETEPKIGDEMEFHVERYDKREGILILTRKGAVSSDVNWENLEIGQVVEGTVTGVNKGGLELQIKGMRAFMPAGQVDLYFQPDLNVYKDQRLQAEVMQFDRAAKNLVVSRRNILEREREIAKQKMLEEIAEGQTRRGTVRSVMDYGAFIDLGGLDGLLHVSEMTHRRNIKPSDIVKVGDAVEVKVIKFDRESGKMSLSLKQTGPDPWVGVENRYSAGAEITGRISKVVDFGAFIEVEEGIEGLLPISEISHQRIRHPSDVVKEGDTVRLKVLSVDPQKKRMSFSLKQAVPEPLE
ncbi:MAG: 30S ribosomal protein S1 [Tepidisphaeraceae bacterium]